MSISAIAGDGVNGKVRSGARAVVAERVFRGKGMAMERWSVVEAVILVSMGFMGGWALNVIHYSAAHGLPLALVASSSLFSALVSSLIASSATVGWTFALGEGGTSALTRSGLAETVTVFTALTFSAVGLHTALWVVGA